MGRVVDLSGKKFGSLLVIEQLPHRSSAGDVMWLCKCDCGELYQANGRRLRIGAVKSCGCYRKVPDLTGARFGKLVVISREENVRHQPVWRCKCDCGTEKLFFAHNLISGGTKSCGCVSGRSGQNVEVPDGYTTVRIGDDVLHVSVKAYKRFYKLGYQSITDEQARKTAFQLCELGVTIKEAKKRL